MKTRKLSELLQLLIDHHKKHFFGGLCAMISKLYCNFIINMDEAELLFEFIKKNKPMSEFRKQYPARAYYFEPCIWKPRGRYLKYRIKKLKAQGL